MKTTFYFLVLILLLFPPMAKQLKIFDGKPLSGAFYPTDNISFSKELWLSGEFQNKKDSYIKDHIGFRNHLIRLYNQLLFSLFNKPNTPGVVIGEDNYLYLEEYIDNYTGKNFVGEQSIAQITTRIKYLQDYFKQRNITLITVFAPSKASFYPEYIPKRYNRFDNSNYSEFIKQYQKKEILHIDLIQYFNQIKDTCSVPLFPKNGLHWSSYGMFIGIDTIAKKISSVSGVKVSDIIINRPITFSGDIKTPDADVEEIMNLYLDIPKDAMPYPTFKYRNSTASKPKVLVISDSYYWQVYTQNVAHNLFDWGGFWYYSKTGYKQENSNEIKFSVEQAHFQNELVKQNVIVLLASQATLNYFPFDFDKKAYFEFMPQDSLSLNNYYKHEIRNNAVWYKTIVDKARANNVTEDEQLIKDADWMSKKYIQDHETIESKIEKIKAAILKDAKWKASVEEKAKVKNISFEEMLHLDAEWVLNYK